jgi:hypothetical protein
LLGTRKNSLQRRKRLASGKEAVDNLITHQMVNEASQATVSSLPSDGKLFSAQYFIGYSFFCPLINKRVINRSISRYKVELKEENSLTGQIGTYIEKMLIKDGNASISETRNCGLWQPINARLPISCTHAAPSDFLGTKKDSVSESMVTGLVSFLLLLGLAHRFDQAKQVDISFSWYEKRQIPVPTHEPLRGVHSIS